MPTDRDSVPSRHWYCANAKKKRGAEGGCSTISARGCVETKYDNQRPHEPAQHLSVAPIPEPSPSASPVGKGWGTAGDRRPCVAAAEVHKHGSTPMGVAMPCVVVVTRRVQMTQRNNNG